MEHHHNRQEGDKSLIQNLNPNLLFQDMISKLGKNMRLDAVILFGSRATGHATEDSDYDIVIIADFKVNRYDRIKIMMGAKPRVPVDVFCFTPQEFEKAFNDFDLTAIDAIGEGIVLYGDLFVKPFSDKYARLVQAGMRKKKSVLILPPITATE